MQRHLYLSATKKSRSRCRPSNCVGADERQHLPPEILSALVREPERRPVTLPTVQWLLRPDPDADGTTE
jgi:hypothetical protein